MADAALSVTDAALPVADAALPWPWLQQALLLAWVGLLGPLLLLGRHLPRSPGRKYAQPREGPASAGPRSPGQAELDLKLPGEPGPWKAEASRKAVAAASWSSLFGCCASRGSEVELAQVSEPLRRPWQAHEVAACGVPEEAVGDIARLAGILGASGAEPLCDPLTLWRFWRSREGDVEAAAAMYRTSVAWRSRFPICEVMRTHGRGEDYLPDGSLASSDPTTWAWQRSTHTPEAAFLAKHGVFGRLRRPAAADGAPIAIWRMGCGDLEGIAREGLESVLERGFVAHMEDLLQSGRAASQRQKRVVRCRLIVDGHGISVGTTVKRLALVKKLASLGKAYFPEVNASVTVVNVPKAVAQIWMMAEQFLTPVMRAKVCMLGADFDAGLQAHAGIDRSDLPAFMGGQASDDEVCAALPVPKGAGVALRSALEASG